MMHERPCPLCGDLSSAVIFAEARFDAQKLDAFAFASRKLPEYMHHRLLHCRECDIVCASPAPDPGELSSAYRDAAFDSQLESEQAAKTYVRALRPIFARLPDRGRVLDIGAGDGAFLYEMQREGFPELCGIEPSTAPLAAARPEIRDKLIHGLFDPDRIERESCSLATCFQTIEHVDDPLGLCRAVYQILKPGGMFCLVGHNRRAFSAKLLGHWSPIFDIEHLQLFSPKSFKRLLVMSGFDSIVIHSLWNSYQIPYWMRLFPGPRGAKSLAIRAANAAGLGRLPLRLPAGNLIAFGQKSALSRSPRPEVAIEVGVLHASSGIDSGFEGVRHARP